MKFRVSDLFVLVVVLELFSGCVSSKEADRRAKQAYITGQRDALAKQNKTDQVWIVGNVLNPLIPWTEDLSLAKAIIAAAWRGSHDPSDIILIREGSQPFHFTPGQLLQGFDMPLKPGDRIELRQ